MILTMLLQSFRIEINKYIINAIHTLFIIYIFCKWLFSATERF